ncbi:hypothetical protein [Paracoccus sulfuroxidans]|uniref:Cell pole-organizing protein PopZ n=1 Tax=Paracoccus sulfuroxidans TaxID=384678 RepID=A0A562NM24_9RHOB|nr:hypothetical protein [Paracoccus sulfuroxidans]TWI33255.1 hypothetical protein IQ24_02396 [Paracoccus sulfuroxidans]
MQNDVMHAGQTAMVSENVGDVLASIRRLIAQDGGAGRLMASPDVAAAFRHADLLNARVAESATPDLRQVAAPPPEEMTAPLTLERDNLVAPEAPSQPVLRLHLTPSFADLPEPEASHPVAAATQVDTAPAASPKLEAPAPVWPAAAAAALSTQNAEPAPVVVEAAMPQLSQAVDPPVTPIAAALTEDLAPPVGLASPDAPPPEEVADLHLFAPEDEELAYSSVLRSLIRDAIRQELQGEMGGRFSRNLRQVIRHEVDLALRQARRARPSI